MSLLVESAIFLAAAVIAVPIFRRLGFGSVLGYLAAGLVIGPTGFALIGNVEDVMHFAEFGVVLLLFIIGLELRPQRLWTMRRRVFGFGTAQVLLSAGLLTMVALGLAVTVREAVLIGLVLALSSTAFALQILEENRDLTARYGRLGFSMLLFQDLAVIPLLAVIPFMTADAAAPADSAVFLGIAEAVAVIAAFVVVGHYFLQYALRLVARSRTREVFHALALLTVIGSALIMEAAGLSMSLGAFLAGVLLADSEYRHEMEANIEPFKGLLLGLFFISVGMSVDIALLLERPGVVATLVLALMIAKGAVLFGLGRFAGLPTASSARLAATLAQGGEFAFVLFGAAVAAGALNPEIAALLIVVVTASMIATPFAVTASRLIPRPGPSPAERRFDRHLPQENPVIIAGFGRVGQVVGRMLRAKRIPFTALEINPEQVDFVRRFGSKIYYGDASRLELLHAAGADRASGFVLAIDDMAASLSTAETVRRHFPRLPVYARARNRRHAHLLMDLGIEVIRRETFLSSLDLAGEVLKGLGIESREAGRAVEHFKAQDERRLKEQHGVYRDEAKLAAMERHDAAELERLFEEDEHARADQ